MGHPKKRGRRWYACLWDREAKKRIEKPLPRDVATKAAARRETDRLQTQLDRKRLGLPPNPQNTGRVSDVLAACVTSHHLSDDREAALDLYSTRFVRHSGDPSAAAVTADDCRAFIRDRMTEDKASPELVRKEVSFLRRAFREAVESGEIDSNPWATVKAPAKPPARHIYLSPAEIDSLLAASPPHRRLRWHLLLATGARMSEALNLTWSDVDLKARRVRITNASKGRGPDRLHRTIPIPKALADALEEVKGKPAEPVLAYPNNWNRDLRVDLKHAGITAERRNQIRVHDLRHTYASVLLQSGACDLARLAALMGHASIQTTMTYAHLLPSDQWATADAFERFGVNRGEESETK